MTATLNETAAIQGDVLDDGGTEMRVGGTIAALFFVGLLGWAALTPLDAGAFAQGLVAVSGNRQAVQHRDGGVITALNVHEGKTVRKGDMLLRISASELVAAERATTAEILTLQAQRMRLLAERDHAPAMAEPTEFARLTQVDRALADEAMRAQRLLFEARRNAIAIERGVLEQRVRQHAEQIHGYGSQIASNRKQQGLIGDELAGLKGLVDRGFVSINRIRAIERSAAALDGEHGSYRADIARSFEAIGEARMQAVSLDKQMLEDVAGQLRDVQMRLDELQPKLIATREQLARSIVRAPASGRVVGLKLFTVGGVVTPGETVMEIVPQDRALVIEARVAPNDADDVRPGMSTQVRFTALQERNLPILHGRISKISADSFEDDRTGMRYFNAEIIVPPSELAKIRKIRADGGLRAGLTAEVLVPLRKRSAFGYLMEPLTQTLWRAGREH
jgi:HlyD family secretion protein